MECTSFINSNIFVRDLGVRYSKSSSPETNYWKRVIAEASEPLDDEGSTARGCTPLPLGDSGELGVVVVAGGYWHGRGGERGQRRRARGLYEPSSVGIATGSGIPTERAVRMTASVHTESS